MYTPLGTEQRKNPLFQMAQSRIWCMFIILVVHWMSVLAQSTTYYQMAYSGYLLTVPGVTDVKYRSQSDAQNWCNRSGSSLLEILNDNVQNAAVQFINDARSQGQMTGNNIITNGKQIGLGRWTWLTGTSAQDKFPISGQEGGMGYSHGYLNTNPSGFSAVADSPTTTKLYICDGKQSDCTNGYQTNGRCYRSFNDSRLSWYDSRNRCLQGGGDLASFEWMSSSQDLNALSGSWLTSSESYWIGLRRHSWTWQYSKTDVKYSQWSNGHPIYDQNQQCICLLPYDWKWGECSCSQSYQFVCISAAPSFSSPSISSTSTTTQSVSSSSSHSIALTSITFSNSHSTISAISSSNDSLEKRALGLAVGLGVGIPAVVIVAALITVIFLQRRKLRAVMNKDPQASKSTVTAVKMTENSSTEPYEPLNNTVPIESARTYEQLKTPDSTSVYEQVAN